MSPIRPTHPPYTPLTCPSLVPAPSPAPAAARPVIPKRGEKDFEPAPGGASGLQLHNLDRARDAMLAALRSTRATSRSVRPSALSRSLLLHPLLHRIRPCPSRVLHPLAHRSKSISHATWDPALARAHVTLARGIHFSSMGHSVARPAPVPYHPSSASPNPLQSHTQTPTQPHLQKRPPKRLELLPEEALYLVEKGALLCSKPADIDADDGGGGGVHAPPMSVQQAFAEMLGRDGLSLEKYQVRARSPSLPLHPHPHPSLSPLLSTLPYLHSPTLSAPFPLPLPPPFSFPPPSPCVFVFSCSRAVRQVFSYLRRLGYVVTRARAPSPAYPVPTPYPPPYPASNSASNEASNEAAAAATESTMLSVVRRIFAALFAPFAGVVRVVAGAGAGPGWDAWRPLVFKRGWACGWWGAGVNADYGACVDLALTFLFVGFGARCAGPSSVRPSTCSSSLIPIPRPRRAFPARLLIALRGFVRPRFMSLSLSLSLSLFSFSLVCWFDGSAICV